MSPKPQAPPAPTDPLDQRLIAAARDLLRERGLEGLTLRGIARHAGVSHGAPLRHYRGLADLLAEVAAEGFRELAEAVEKSGAQLPAGSDPRERLREGGRAYVRAATAEPALFALMFRNDRLDPANARLRADGAAAFETVVQLVRAAQDAGWQTRRDTRALAGSVWASVHGLAQLWSQGAYGEVVPGISLDQALEQSLALLLPD